MIRRIGSVPDAPTGPNVTPLPDPTGTVVPSTHSPSTSIVTSFAPPPSRRVTGAIVPRTSLTRPSVLPLPPYVVPMVELLCDTARVRPVVRSVASAASRAFEKWPSGPGGVGGVSSAPRLTSCASATYPRPRLIGLLPHVEASGQVAVP